MIRKPMPEDDLNEDMPLFRGADYTPELDEDRLSSGLRITIAVMRDGAWRTKHEIACAAEAQHDKPVSMESIGRYLRYAREDRNGGWVLQKRRRGDPTGGLYEYRLCRPGDEETT